MLQAVLGTILVGGVFFAIDLILGHIFHPDLPLFKAAMHSGGPTGIALTRYGAPSYHGSCAGWPLSGDISGIRQCGGIERRQFYLAD
jgi:hypothetical protein